MESHLDVLWPPTLLLPPCVGHHTVCAALIAPVDHVHPGAYVAVSPWNGHILHDLDGVCGHHLAPLVHLIKQLMQPAGKFGKELRQSSVKLDTVYRPHDSCSAMLSHLQWLNLAPLQLGSAAMCTTVLPIDEGPLVAGLSQPGQVL